MLEKVDAVHVKAVLAPLVDKDSVLYTDGAAVYSSFCKATGIKHEVIPRKGPSAFHIQNVNAFDSRLKEWMRRVHGVVTKYLANDSGGIERYQAISPDILLFEAVGRKPQQLIQT
jgi:hypothetical protein